MVKNKYLGLRQRDSRIECKGKGEMLMRYVCGVCGYVYDPKNGDPDHGIAPGTPFEELPEDWTCPDCSVGKGEFAPE